MGGVLEPTSAMGEYRTEVRGESAYLYSPDRFRLRPGGVAFPAVDRAAVLAALDQVAAHLQRTDHEPAPAGPVHVRCKWDIIAVDADGWLYVYGPGAIEIMYPYVGALRAAIAAAG